MKNIYIFISLFFSPGCSNTIATPEPPEIFISTEQIRKLTDELFYDDKIAIDINGDGTKETMLHYAYSKIGPAHTCEPTQDCAQETTSIITFYLDLPEAVV